MKIETKFNVGQEVFYIEHGNIISGIVQNISITIRKPIDGIISIKTIYVVNSTELTDIECFATPNDLLKHIERKISKIKL